MTAAVITIELAGMPRGKGRPRFRFVRPKNKPGFVSTYTDEKTRDFEGNLSDVAGAAMAGRPPLDGAIEVTVTCYMAVPASWSAKRQREALAGVIRPTVKPDWDNFAKVCDALNGIVFRDDAAVVDGHVHKFYSARPRTLIVVKPVVPQILDPRTGEVRSDPLPLLAGVQ